MIRKAGADTGFGSAFNSQIRDRYRACVRLEIDAETRAEMPQRGRRRFFLYLPCRCQHRVCHCAVHRAFNQPSQRGSRITWRARICFQTPYLK